MKKVLSICLIIAMMLSVFAITASASPVVMGGYANARINGLYYDVNEGDYTATVVGYDIKDKSSPAGKLTVPSVITFEGLPYTVDEIGYGAFYQSLYTEIVLPSTITAIDNIAFSASIYLNNVKIPADCEFSYVGGDLFMGTPYEAKVYESDAFYMGKNVLYKFNGSGEFTIPENVNLLASKCFMWSDIQKVVFNNNIEEIPLNCFSSCQKLTEVVFTDSITSVDDGAFMDCVSLENITLGENVGVLGEDCFANTKIKSIHLGENVYDINGSFKNCTTLEAVTVDSLNTVLSVKNNMIYREVYFPNIDANGKFTLVEGLSIAYCVPKYATGKIQLPNSVKGIDRFAFYGCKDLEEVVAGEILFVNSNAFQNSGIKKFTAKGYGSTGHYLVYDEAFKNCENLTEINIENVEYFGSSAFENCTALTGSITLNTMGIGGKAFANTGITEVTVNGLDNGCEIDEGAFMNCENLEKVTLKDAVTNISQNAFLGCENLKVISLSKDIQFIDENAFNGCENVKFEVIKGSYAYKFVKNAGLNFEVVGNYSFWQRIIDFFRNLFG